MARLAISPRLRPSLPEAHRTVSIPAGASVWRKVLAFAGPGYMVAVGCMDPGTGPPTSQAVPLRVHAAQRGAALQPDGDLLQSLALKLGLVTGRDLAQACRDHYSRPVSFVLWVLCEDRDRGLRPGRGDRFRVALNLLFGIPLVWGVIFTAADVLPHPAAAAARLPPARGLHHLADRDHRHLLRRRTCAGCRRPARY
jgi:manganese transport protein